MVKKNSEGEGKQKNNSVAKGKFSDEKICFYYKTMMFKGCMSNKLKDKERKKCIAAVQKEYQECLQHNRRK